MKLAIYVLLFLSIISWSYAEDQIVYVTDKGRYTLREEANNKSKIIKMLNSGTELILLEKDQETGYSEVATKDGKEGYIVSRFISQKPTAKMLLVASTTQLTALQEKCNLLQQDFDLLQEVHSEVNKEQKSTAKQHDTLRLRFNELQEASGHCLQLKNERDQLQKRVVSVERQMQQLKMENQALKDSEKQDWFVYGGLLALAGIILGFLLPKLSWRRKSGWDRF